MNNFLDKLNENLNKVYQKKLKEGKHIITISELFTGVKEYMDIGEYFERFCNDYNTGWKWNMTNNEPLDFDLTERRITNV